MAYSTILYILNSYFLVTTSLYFYLQSLQHKEFKCFINQVTAI